MGEGLARYVLACGHAPGWMTEDGYPASWGHYGFMIGNLDRLKAQAKLDLHEAVKMAQPEVKKEDRARFAEELKLYSGWRD